MPVSDAEIAKYADLYLEAAGTRPKYFVCPITLNDEPDAILCDGHILCQKLKNASRATVVQRADVDNAFGTLVERDFVSIANVPCSDPAELLKLAKKLHVTGPTGEKMPAFFAGPEARECFQQIELYDDNGKAFAAPFLRAHKVDAGMYRQMEVEWLVLIHKHAFTAALLKSAYLTMFRIFGYSWVLDSAGDKVRRTLAACLREPDRRRALDHFSEFQGSCWITFNDRMDGTQDTLGDGTLFFHYAEGDAKTGILFAVSCLFWVNDKLLAVTLPSYQRTGFYFVAWKYYQEFIRNHRLQHNIHLGRQVDLVVKIDPKPMSLHYTSTDPPNPESAILVSPMPA